MRPAGNQADRPYVERDMILLIDNYDSFVYNLARYFRELGCATRVARNDALSVDAVCRLRPRAVVLSPGPCGPSEAGISVELVRSLPASIPILGVCLGHQAIAAAYGGRIERAPAPVHGSGWRIGHESTRLFDGIPNPFLAARYHSLCVVPESLPRALCVTARSADGVVMALEHAARPVYGVQFHPESILTESGHRLLANFLSIAGVGVTSPPRAGDALAPSPTADEYFTAPPTGGETVGAPVHWSDAPLPVRDGAGQETGERIRRDGTPLHW